MMADEGSKQLSDQITQAGFGQTQDEIAVLRLISALMPINGGCVHRLTTRDPGSERRELLYDQFAAFLYERYQQEEARTPGPRIV